MNKPFLKAMLIIVSLGLLCLFGNGCCTYYAVELTCKKIHDKRSTTKRIGSLDFERKVFTVEIEDEIESVYSPFQKKPRYSKERKKLSYPLDSSPSNAKKFEIHVELDENASRSWTSDYNYDYSGGELMHYNKAATSLPLSVFVFMEHDIASSKVIKMKIHPDDVNGLSKPFYLHSLYTERNEKRRKGKKADVKKDKPMWIRKDMMIPYRINDKVFYVYSIRHGMSYYSSDSNLPPIMDYHYFVDINKKSPNAASYVYSAVLVPPALVIDIVTLPITIPVVVCAASFILNNIGNLGP